jgi:autotransporter-associated beta strand protein
MLRQFLAAFSSWACLTTILCQVCDASPTLNEIQSLNTSGNVTAALYSSQYNLLFLRDSTADVRVLNATTGAQLSLRTPSATGAFTDFAISPSGQYLYVADYGGTNIGYGTPSNPSYVNRYDLQNGTWTSAQAPGIAYHIAPVDDNRVLLLEVDQWVDLTLNTYTPGAMSQLSSISPGYSGNIEFGASLNRIYYNETGLSSENVRAFNLSGNTMTSAEITSGISYGNYSAVLSSDGTALYYAQKGLKASDLTKVTSTFSEIISAASPDLAFGTSHYYDPTTGAALGVVPFTPLTWTVGANGRDVWAVQQPSGGGATLHHFIIGQSVLWSTPGSGSWADIAKWNPNALPDGMDNTADLSQVTLATDSTVTLDGNRTIGHMIFGDLGASRNWTVTAGSGGVLNMQVMGGTPHIAVSNQTTTINVPIAGTQGLLKDGLGTLALGAINTYTGGTTINSGTLMVAADNNLGSGSLAINAGTFRTAGNIASPRAITLQNAASAIQVDGAFNYTASSGATVSGTGGLTKTGTGTLDLTAATVNFSGTTTVNAGTLNLSSLTSTAQTTVASAAALNVSSANLTLGPLANSGNVNFTNAAGTITMGTLTGTGTTTFSAGASIPTMSGGTISVAGPASITTATGGTANLSGASASITTLSNTAVNLASGTALSVAAGTQTAGGIIGAGSLTKTGTGTLTLGFDNTYSAGTTISAGTLQIGNGGATGSIVGNVTDSGSLIFNRSDSYTFAGVVSGSGALQKSGTGTLTLTGANTYTGGTTINTGTLQLGNGILPGSVVGNLTNKGVLILNTPAPSQTLSGSVSGTGSIVKMGPGTQVLTGVNTNTGGTTISSGILQIGDGSTAGSITGNVTDNAALVFNRSDNVNFTGTITGSGRVEQAGGGTLTLAANVSNALKASNGRVVVAATGTLSGDVTTNAAGRVENGGGAIHIANLDNSGIFSGTADLAGTFLNRASGDVRLAAGQNMLVQSSAAHTNAGLLEVLGNPSSYATFESVGPFTNAAGGNSLIIARDANLRFDAGLTNLGALSMNYGLSDVFGDINNAAGGTIAIAGGAGITFYDDVVQNGTMLVSASGSTHSSAIFLGSLSGSGGATGGGDIIFLGDMRPGNSPASVTFANNVTFARGALNVEIGGATIGTQYDHVNVTGDLSLGGTLNVSLINSFTPAVGQTFDLLDWGTLVGSFSAVQLPALPSGLWWNTSQLYTTGTLSVAAASPADFNHNGIVDGADYLMWRKGLGTTYTPSDYNTWRTQFGETAGMGAAAAMANTAIPEPATLLQIILAASSCLCPCRRRSTASASPL